MMEEPVAPSLDMPATDDGALPARSIELQREPAGPADTLAAGELKDEFLAMISHELKNPLNLIHLNAELLARLPETKALPSVARAAEKRLTLEQRLADGPVIVDADAQRLEQIVHNLLGNAFKSTPAGGRVTVSLRREAGFGVLETCATAAAASTRSGCRRCSACSSWKRASARATISARG